MYTFKSRCSIKVQFQILFTSIVRILVKISDLNKTTYLSPFHVRRKLVDVGRRVPVVGSIINPLRSVKSTQQTRETQIHVRVISLTLKEKNHST